MSLKDYPINGKFGDYGGQFIPETLMPAIKELESAYNEVKNESNFRDELADYLSEYAGRPTPFYCAKNLTDLTGGVKIYLKREDLTHGEAHKLNKEESCNQMYRHIKRVAQLL